ncbi:AAA family ATPase [Candidatus Woesearchaeota archaeon]|nr:AAA family ATPase [Candidatus Woesearchaeota archaeon]
MHLARLQTKIIYTLESYLAKMNITVTGFSGTGKTTISMLLARSMSKKLISTDEEIRKSMKLSPERIVKRYGWERLREAEASIIENISELDNYVLDAGCGVLLRNENVVNLKKSGIIVFLTADARAIASRLKRKEEKTDFTKSNYIDKVKGALDEFETRHKKAADYAIDTSDMSPEEACSLIIHYVQLELH